DSKDGRITPPMPPFGVEVRGDEDKKPTEPVRLGAPGNIVHRARIQLRGDPLNLPRDLDLTTDFADYHSTYNIKDGVLTAERRLVLKKDRVPLAESEAYRKFGKLVADDEDTWINLSGNNNTAESDHNSPADRAFLQGYEALQKRDMTTAGEAFRRVIQLDPKYAYAHGNLGLVYLAQNDNEDAFAELRKEEELHPENEFAYRALALALVRLHRNEEAMQQWRQLLKVDPKNRDAVLGLGGLLIRAKKYGEAVSVLEDAAKLAPDSEALQSTLGYAYLKNGQTDKGIPVLEKVAQSDPKPETLNNIGYELADANVDLDKSLAYAQKAVEQTQAQSLVFGASSPESLKITVELAADWDTLGWVYFRRGDLSKAESYVRAGWNLSQDATIGDHLAQVYEREGKKQEAAHIYRLALASPRGDKEEIRQHYRQLTGKNADEGAAVSLGRGKNGTRITSPVEELSRVRETKLRSTSRLSGSATYAVAFSHDKVDEVSYVSGDSSLNSVADQLSNTKFHVEFPGQDPVKLVRRGILMCGATGCDFVMLLPADAAAQAQTPNN
ncbi:MAG TPA: tetratricopeptide repeat protein, partial [Terriglobales bacterium]|nr:tetratricopeptide repeat protein [Terriglobales bacterium]